MTCRTPGCDRTPERGRFCSERCRVKYDHLMSDRPTRPERHPDDAPRIGRGY